MKTTTTWFTSLGRRRRKEVLSSLHAARRAATDEKEVERLLALINALDEDHFRTLDERGYSDEGVAPSRWDRLAG